VALKEFLTVTGSRKNYSYCACLCWLYPASRIK